MTAELLRRYQVERPYYEEAAKTLADRLGECCLNSGIHAVVTHRAKDVDSLVKKVILHGKTYDEVIDRAGVRVVPLYSDQKSQIVQLMKKRFEVQQEKDHTLELGFDRFGYRGHHFVVNWPAKTTSGNGVLPVEVQVHTLGENVWATISHDLAYKPDQQLPRDVARLISRLSALLELVDEGVSDARGKIGNLEAAAEARMLRILEKYFLRLLPKRYDREFSLHVLEAIAPLAGDLATFERRIDDFVQHCGPKIRHILEDYSNDTDGAFLSQPEILLLFYLAETQEGVLEERWPEELPRRLLQVVESVWIPGNDLKDSTPH